MALFELGVLTGAASTRAYLTMMIAGYSLGLAVDVFETTRLERAGFTVQALIESYLTYDLGRAPMTLGHIALIGLLCRAPALAGAMRTLAAVGQMALTNYLSQSLICLFVFTGAGLALFGELERHELYYIVAAIWIAQLVWSPLWLAHFCFGPAEWLWRSLTYWSRQPMRRAPRAPRRRRLAVGRHRLSSRRTLIKIAAGGRPGSSCQLSVLTFLSFSSPNASRDASSPQAIQRP